MSNASVAAERLATFLRARGVTVSIELQQDVRGTWDALGKRGVISHHTASHDYQGNTPMLALVKRGRPGVPGPLCNGYGGRDLVYRIICMGKANHAGTGGPLTLAGTTPRDSGNTYLWGTEYEGGYEDFTPAMREFMARANQGLLDYFGWGPSAHGEHKTWAPTRKIDRLGYTTASGRDEIIRLGSAGGTLQPVNNTITPPSAGGNPWKGKDPNAPVAPGSRTVRLYSAGTDVAALQAVVGVSTDGYYGQQTLEAVKRFQGANGLVADGIVGPLTWGKVLTPVPAPAAGGIAAPPFPLPAGHYFGWKTGPAESVSGFYSHREDLRLWQQRMKDRGWGIDVDGLYGPNTNEVAKLFQREKGLSVDGAIGPSTWAAAWTAPIT